MSEAGTAKRVPSLLLYEVSRQFPFPPLALVPNETPAAIPAGVSPSRFDSSHVPSSRATMCEMTKACLTIREEEPADRDTVRAVNQAAFGGDVEADLVVRLHADGEVLFGLVAEAHGRVVGHILFSRLPVQTRDGEVIATAALAPLAVLPEWQRQGIGSKLVLGGLAQCRDRGVPAVVVLGDPAYYGRFGFRAETARGLRTPWPGPYLMAVALTKAGEGIRMGAARYPAAFAALPAGA